MDPGRHQRKGAAPPLRRVLETALYVDDLARARAFYEDLLGLPVMFANERLVALDAGAGTVLLLFRRGGSIAPAADDGSIPGHDGRGPVHMAFAIDRDRAEAWRHHLTGRGVAIEAEKEWPRGGLSLYFRDPDGHLLELATPGIWSVY